MTILSEDNPKHAAADERLRTAPIAWLTTVNAAGQPQSTPVWFLWADGEFLIYGAAKGPKTAHIAAHPQVSLHLDGDGRGGAVVVFEGSARLDADAPAADEVPAYVAKYQAFIEGNGWTAASFARDYPHPIRVTPTRARIW